jgi:hypothetical protein
MPRIPPNALNCVCCLYEDVDDARVSREFGGYAFIVCVLSPFVGKGFLYAVTNRHVACQNTSMVKVSTREGGTDIFSFGPDEWQFDPRYDIAAVPIAIRADLHRVSCIWIEDFATPEGLEKARVGPGDDVFMAGRFIDDDGGPISRPGVRFGNISMTPAPIEQENIGMADAFCIDLHSRTGYSGSPVFVHRTPGFDLEEVAPEDIRDRRLLVAGRRMLMPLGIHFAQFPEEWEVRSGARKSEAKPRVPLIEDGAYVRGLSGMTCVLPAWSIREVLNLPRLKRWREEAEAQEAERQRREGMPPIPWTCFGKVESSQ